MLCLCFYIESVCLTHNNTARRGRVSLINQTPIPQRWMYCDPRVLEIAIHPAVRNRGLVYETRGPGGEPGSKLNDRVGEECITSCNYGVQRHLICASLYLAESSSMFSLLDYSSYNYSPAASKFTFVLHVTGLDSWTGS